eukprot:7383362-Prymnesium_polylepis.1
MPPGRVCACQPSAFLRHAGHIFSIPHAPAAGGARVDAGVRAARRAHAIEFAPVEFAFNGGCGGSSSEGGARNRVCAGGVRVAGTDGSPHNPRFCWTLRRVLGIDVFRQSVALLCPLDARLTG